MTPRNYFFKDVPNKKSFLDFLGEYKSLTKRTFIKRKDCCYSFTKNLLVGDILYFYDARGNNIIDMEDYCGYVEVNFLKTAPTDAGYRVCEKYYGKKKPKRYFYFSTI